MGIKEFKIKFENLGYTFQSPEVLEDVYLFYKYYDSKANKGVASIYNRICEKEKRLGLR